MDFQSFMEQLKKLTKRTAKQTKNVLKHIKQQLVALWQHVSNFFAQQTARVNELFKNWQASRQQQSKQTAASAISDKKEKSAADSKKTAASFQWPLFVQNLATRGKQLGQRLKPHLPLAKKIGRAFVLLLFATGFAVGGVLLGYFASLTSGSDIPSKEALSHDIHHYELKTTLYYANEEPIGTLRTDLARTPVTISEISPNVIEALVAIEDESFFNHPGIVPKALLRSLMQQLLRSDQTTGGSTLTQQLVKQQLLTSEVTFSRKANEILLALRLEKYFSKEEILEAYLNVSPFGRNNSGQNIAGIEEAAQGIFGKSAAELNVPQAAFLAGLPQNPITYSPYDQHGELIEDFQSGLERMQDVLFAMYRSGYLTANDYETYQAYDLAADFLPGDDNNSSRTKSFVYDLVEEQAREIIFEQLIKEEKLEDKVHADSELYDTYQNKADDLLRHEGYQVHSTIHADLHQALANETENIQTWLGPAQETGRYTENGEWVSEVHPLQMGASVIENDTGRVLAFVGGIDYDYSEFNIPFDTRRSSGSTIKPLLVYGPALAEKYISPATVLPDTPLTVADGQSGSHTLKNYGATTNEWRSARHWLKVSQNLPNTRVFLALQEGGVDLESYARNMGLSSQAITTEEFGNASTALGGFNGGPTITEITGAYAAIANGGVHNEPYVIEKIVDAQDKVIYEHTKETSTIWPAQPNYLLIDMLRDVTGPGGLGYGLKDALNFNSDLFSKSGTTDESRDMWYIGSTPGLSLGFWMGYDGQDLSIPVSGHQNSRSAWAALMNAMYAADSSVIGVGEEFPRPNGIVERQVLEATGMLPGKIKAPNGNEVSVAGKTINDLFWTDNLPQTTTYQFSLWATPQEYVDFWNNYLVNSLKEKKKETDKEKKKDRRKKKDDEDDKEEEETEESEADEEEADDD